MPNVISAFAATAFSLSFRVLAMPFRQPQEANDLLNLDDRLLDDIGLTRNDLDDPRIK